MSKRKLKEYLGELSKAELEEQILELHDRLKEVKDFYAFVFNPRENERLDEAKLKIAKEYFPPSGRKAKKRRSVAQKYIKEFLKLGVDPQLIADIMLYNIEIAAAYTADTPINQDAFYKSMHKSFQETIQFLDQHGIFNSFEARIEKLMDTIHEQNWINQLAFEHLLDKRVK